jgi:hypothetical protein
MIPDLQVWCHPDFVVSHAPSGKSVPQEGLAASVTAVMLEG